MASNIDIVQNKWTGFLKSNTFWWVVVFILLAGFYLYITDPDVPQVDYTGFDENGDPVVWMTRTIPTGI